MKKKLILTSIITAICLLAIPLSIISFGFLCPPQFDETYYGELPYMFNRLKKADENKIIVVGNSAVAFGLRPDLIEKETNHETIGFGLYGAIGTKAMMDLSKVGIKKGDIVLLAPEISEQGLSLYYSCENMWRSIDGHYEMLNYVEKSNRQAMVGNFANFAASKFSYLTTNKKPAVEGVYTQYSFNKDDEEIGYMTYERSYNTMLNGYDQNSMITFDVNYLSDDFIKYINDYADYVYRREAEIYFSFVPMNSLSLNSSSSDIDAFYTALKEKINFPILGNPHNYLFDYEWFYDNNCHMNSSGMFVYNYQLVEDLKIIFEDTSKTDIVIPDKPVTPTPDYEDGDNSDIDCFTYQSYENGYRITGLTDLGASKEKLIIPSLYNDLPVILFDENVFKNNTAISEIVVPKNIRGFMDHSFVGCKNLTKIIIQHDNPNRINVGMALLDGADNCSVYIKESAYDNFANHYNWGYYRNKLKKY